jgi:hypothetical protein
MSRSKLLDVTLRMESQLQALTDLKAKFIFTCNRKELSLN